MITFSGMPSNSRSALLASVAIAAMAALACLAGPARAAAKSPEDFVGPAAPQPAPAQPPGNQKAQPKNPPAAAVPAPAAKPAPGAKPVSAKPMMDTAALHATYLDGDFDRAIKVMEAALKSKKTPITHGDSVFIFKHLGVMYAATPATREKGRYYMAQLIYIEPTAKILDMYASDMIYLIFRNVQEEFATKHPNVAQPAAVAVDTTPKAPPAPAPAPAAQPVSANRKKAYWITGGAVVAVGAIGLLYVLLDSPEPKHRSIVVQE
jgi:hypothetical protein